MQAPWPTSARRADLRPVRLLSPAGGGPETATRLIPGGSTYDTGVEERPIPSDPRQVRVSIQPDPKITRNDRNANSPGRADFTRFRSSWPTPEPFS
jgi:hypothetical protein